MSSIQSDVCWHLAEMTSLDLRLARWTFTYFTSAKHGYWFFQPKKYKTFFQNSFRETWPWKHFCYLKYPWHQFSTERVWSEVRGVLSPHYLSRGYEIQETPQFCCIFTFFVTSTSNFYWMPDLFCTLGFIFILTLLWRHNAPASLRLSLMMARLRKSLGQINKPSLCNKEARNDRVGNEA